MKVEVTVTHAIDGDIPVVYVPLSNSKQKVCLYQEDFDFLIEKGLDPLWRLSYGQILERGTRLSITRLVADAKDKEKVILIDGNPCNLKRSNLEKTNGSRGENTREKLSSSSRPHRLVKLIRDYNNPAWFSEIAKESQK